MGNNLDEPNNYPSFLHGESFQAVAQGEGPRWSLGGLPEWKRWSWEFRETKVTRFHRAEYWKGESCTEKKIPELSKSVSWVPNRTFIGRNYPRPEKDSP